MKPGLAPKARGQSQVPEYLLWHLTLTPLVHPTRPLV